jgi:hypothetical protein
VKHLTFITILIGALAVSVGAAIASQTFSAPIYRSSSYTCSGGAADVSGSKYGTFATVETHGDQTVNASVTLSGLHSDRTYNLSVTESGTACITNLNLMSFTTDDSGKAALHFQFWAHTGETSAWVTIRHGLTDDIVRSTALPINR